jgi:hypothetical protein
MSAIPREVGHDSRTVISPKYHACDGTRLLSRPWQPEAQHFPWQLLVNLLGTRTTDL